MEMMAFAGIFLILAALSPLFFGKIDEVIFSLLLLVVVKALVTFTFSLQLAPNSASGIVPSGWNTADEIRMLFSKGNSSLAKADLRMKPLIP